MNKRQVEDFAEKEILEGKSQQEVFNEIVSTSDFNIHDVANVVRRIPTPEKRKKYNATNSVLCGLLALSILNNTYTIVTEPSNDYIIIVNGIFLIIKILVLQGIYKFKRNAHLATGFLLLLGVLAASVRLFSSFNLVALGDILTTLFGMCLAFYLNARLIADYTLDKELQKTHPEQRENSLVFQDN